MLDVCVVHAFGCPCCGVCMRLYACSVLVLSKLGFCMLHACFVHAFGLPAGVGMRLCACLVLVLCMSLASACFLPVWCLRLAVSACAADAVGAPDAC